MRRGRVSHNCAGQAVSRSICVAPTGNLRECFSDGSGRVPIAGYTALQTGKAGLLTPNHSKFILLAMSRRRDRHKR